MKYIDGYCIVYYENEKNVVAIQSKTSRTFMVAPEYKGLKVEAIYSDGDLIGINISGNIEVDKQKIIAYARLYMNHYTSSFVDELAPISVSFNNEGFGFSDSDIHKYFD